MTEFSPAWLEWPQTRRLGALFGPGRLRFVGGCVRDGLLGRTVSDVDAATTLPPQETMALLEESGCKAIPTGIAHGTVTAVIGGRTFEITTLRRDVATDGRHATVAYTDDWQEDAARRDFTMNALYCDADGALYDYFGGAADALMGKVRFIGSPEERIREDGLRILRFFRFFAHYGKGEIDAEGMAACAVSASLIRTLSGERIRQEMLKLLCAAQAAKAIDVMQEKNVWREVVPAQVEIHGLQRLPSILQTASYSADGILALALLLRSVEGDVAALVDAVAARWKLSRAQHKRLCSLCLRHRGGVRAIAPGDEKQWKVEIRTLGKEDFIDHTLLWISEGGDETAGLAAIALARSWEIPMFPVNGGDLLALGIKPGKEMGKLLRRMEKAWEQEGYRLSAREILQRFEINPLK